MADVFTTERRVEFCQTDAAGIAHFSSYVCFMEQAEHEFWRHIGANVFQVLDDGTHITWPRVRVECDFAGTSQFEDVLQISVRVLRLGTKSVTFSFHFSSQGRPVAQGKIVAVCCQLQRGAGFHSMAIPNSLAERLRPFCHPPTPEN